MPEGKCQHEHYNKTQVDERWAGHATCYVLARRTCSDCGHTQDDWEFGDHESIRGPRMFQDNANFFNNKEEQL